MCIFSVVGEVIEERDAIVKVTAVVEDVAIAENEEVTADVKEVIVAEEPEKTDLPEEDVPLNQRRNHLERTNNPKEPLLERSDQMLNEETPASPRKKVPIEVLIEFHFL